MSIDPSKIKAGDAVRGLDADALNDLPDDSLVLPRAENRPRVRHLGGWFRTPGGMGCLSAEIAPARLLWAPES